MKAGFDMKWNEVRKFVIEEFSDSYDGDPDDDPCFYCPYCGEPIYADDFPYFKMDFKGYPICPICEESFS